MEKASGNIRRKDEHLFKFQDKMEKNMLLVLNVKVQDGRGKTFSLAYYNDTIILSQKNFCGVCQN